jgi:hypothetical protein
MDFYPLYPFELLILNHFVWKEEVDISHNYRILGMIQLGFSDIYFGYSIVNDCNLPFVAGSNFKAYKFCCWHILQLVFMNVLHFIRTLSDIPHVIH